MNMRRLSTREKTLLCILLVLALVGGYIVLFYTPTQDRLTELENKIAQTEDDILTAQVKVERKKAMERELDALFAQDSEPLSLAAYDNIQAVMFELNSILGRAEEYSLNFSSVDTESTIIRRNISLRFRAGSYASAKEILQLLHDGD
jgi:cell division protein FtsL